MRVAMTTAGLVFGLACGTRGYVVLEVHADLNIPSDTNALHILVISPTDRQELVDLTFDLVQGQAFPLEVVLKPSDSTPRTLEEDVTAILDGTPVARLRTQHEWRSGVVNRAVLPPLELIP